MPYELFEINGISMGGGRHGGICGAELCVFDVLCTCDTSEEFESRHVSSV